MITENSIVDQEVTNVDDVEASLNEAVGATSAVKLQKKKLVSLQGGTVDDTKAVKDKLIVDRPAGICAGRTTGGNE